MQRWVIRFDSSDAKETCFAEKLAKMGDTQDQKLLMLEGYSHEIVQLMLKELMQIVKGASLPCLFPPQRGLLPKSDRVD